MGDFISRWVCAAMLVPRVSMTDAEREPDGLIISELTLTTRVAIFTKVFAASQPTNAEVSAATDFPEDGHREGSGPDVPAVPPAPVDSPPNAEPDAGA